MQSQPAKRPPRLSLTVRFLFVVTTVVSLCIAGMITLRLSQRGEVDALRLWEFNERTSLLKGILELTQRPLRDFTRDWAQWDDMIAFAAKPDPAWAAVNLDASLDSLKLSAAWVLGTDGRLIYAAKPAKLPKAVPLPYDADGITRLLAQGAAESFFVWTGDQLLELSLASVVPSADLKHETPPRAWLLAGRLWDEEAVAVLDRLMDTKFFIRRPGAAPADSGALLAISQTVNGRDGRPVAEFHCLMRTRALEITGRYNEKERDWFLTGCAALILLATAFLYGWVVKPLRTITRSLERGDPAPIRELAREPHELGRVAELVETSFQQRQELAQLLADRERLGRELHDGVIQTVYASGMGLAAVQAVMATRPDEAARTLAEVREQLNGAIRDLRSFIAGLEPEGAERPRFEPALESIIRLLNGSKPVAFSTRIDPVLTAWLTPAQSLQLIHVAREAISNSVRHSGATAIDVILQTTRGGGALIIRDNGTGLDAAALRLDTGGLANIAARARELDGASSVQAGERGGTLVRVDFPLAPQAAKAVTAGAAPAPGNQS